MASALVLTPEFPWPLESGSRIREYHAIATLADRFDTTLISLTSGPVSADIRVRFRELGVTIETVQSDRSTTEAALRSLLTRRPYRAAKFGDTAFTDTVHSLLAERSFDLVWAHFLETLAAVPRDVDATVVLDQHNAERAYWESFSNGSLPERLYARLNVRFVERFQRRCADRVDAVLSVDETDAAEAVSWAGEPVFVVPNGVDTTKFAPSTTPSACAGTALFVGSLDVRMNEEALSWFVESVWPRVREAVPDAQFDVVGRDPSARVTRLGDTPGVNVIGYVDDVVPYYDESAVFVAPFSFGGGTKLKILEALAMARPLVTTPLGVKGINVTDGRHALVRARGEGFATAVAEQLDDPDEEMGRLGRRLVDESYSWQSSYETALEQLVPEFEI